MINNEIIDISKLGEKKQAKVLCLVDWGCSTGFGRVAESLIENLSKTGKYSFTVVGVNYYGDPSGQYFISKNLPVIVYPAAIDKSGVYEGNPYGFSKLIKFLDTQQYDLLFINNDHFVVEEFIQEAQKRRSKYHKRYKSIFYYPVDGRMKENWVKKSISLFDYPVAYTNYGKELTLKIDDTLNVDQVYHGVDTEKFYPLPNREEVRNKRFPQAKDAILIGTVNRNQARKDIPRLLQAFGKLLKRGHNAYLYLHMNTREDHVEGWNINEVARECEVPLNRLLVRDNHNVHQGVPVEVLNEIYNSCDIISSTTLGEGFGLASIEAMATKTPVVYPNNTALPEILGYGERGVLVKSGETDNDFVIHPKQSVLRPMTDVNDLVDKWEWVIHNKKEVAEMVEKAYQWTKSLTWEKVSKQFEEIFDRAYDQSIVENNLIRKFIGKKVKPNDKCPICESIGKSIKVKKCAEHRELYQ